MDGQKSGRLGAKLSGNALYVYKTMGKAIVEHAMLANGDKILAAVSGGADSLSMLKLFLLRRRKIPIDFSLTVCFVDTNFIKIDKQKLFDYLQAQGVPYVVRAIAIEKEEERSCFWCSWNRRKVLFETAKEIGCNKIALGHNLDDTAQTIIMNMFFRGQVSTAPANLELFGGALRVIRPICYIAKKNILQFAREMDLPVLHYECPYGKESRRELAKKIIAMAEAQGDGVKTNIVKSLRRIKEGYLV